MMLLSMMTMLMFIVMATVVLVMIMYLKGGGIRRERGQPRPRTRFRILIMINIQQSRHQYCCHDHHEHHFHHQGRPIQARQMTLQSTCRWTSLMTGDIILTIFNIIITINGNVNGDTSRLLAGSPRGEASFVGEDPVKTTMLLQVIVKF